MKDKIILHTREELVSFLQDEIITTNEAAEILECTLQNIRKLVKQRKLIPLRDLGRDKLFLKEDILKRKEELNKRK